MSAGTAKSSPTSKATKLTTERVKAHVLSLSGEFRISEVQTALGGGNTTTIKRGIDQLIESGEVTRIGPLEGYKGTGRAPIVYRR